MISVHTWLPTLAVVLLAAACLPAYQGTTAGASDSGSSGTASTTDDEPTTGTSAPTGDASASTSPAACGDGQIDGGEVCDGAALGGKACEDVDAGFDGGVLECAPDCAGYDTSSCKQARVQVALNEVTTKGVGGGPYSDMGDAIELHAAGAADLSGWKLSTDPSFPADATFVFPPGTTLAPGGFLVLVETAADMSALDLPFGLETDSSATLVLADAGGTIVDEVSFAGELAAVSYCRLPDGTGSWQACTQTFGAANAAAAGRRCGDGIAQLGEECDGADLGGKTCADLGHTGGTLACTPGCTFDDSDCEDDVDVSVALNELESGDDRIELYNAGAAPVDLAGWILTDDQVDANYDPAADPEKLVFPAMTTLAPQQLLVVDKGELPGQHPFGLSAGGDTVTLLAPDLKVVDQVSYAADQAVVSYCRVPDGPGGAWTPGCMPTFGAPNQGP